MESGLGGRTVARLVTPALHRLTVLVVLMAVVAIVGVLLSTRAVNSLTEDLQPAAAANQDVLLDVTALEGAVANWARSADPAAIDEYDQLLARLPGDQQEVRAFAEGDAEGKIARLHGVAGQHQVTDTAKSHKGFGPGALGQPQTNDFRKPTGDQGGAGVVAKAAPVNDTTADGQHVLDRAANLGADQVIGAVDTEHRPGQGVGHFNR